MKFKRLLWLSSFALLSASSCSVTVPNVTVCGVAGSLNDGAMCAETLTSKTTDMTFVQFLEFLEPTDKRGGALCLSTADYAKIKTTIEQACKKGKFCSEEIEKTISDVSARVERVQKKGRGQ